MKMGRGQGNETRTKAKAGRTSGAHEPEPSQCDKVDKMAEMNQEVQEQYKKRGEY